MTTRKLHAVRTPLCLAVGLWLGLLTSEASAAPSPFEDAFVRRMTSSNNDIVWSTFNFCDTTEFPPVCRVWARPADGPPVSRRTVFDNRFFGVPGDNLVGGGEIAADETHVYWQNIDGAIMRHVAASSTGAVELVASKQSAASSGDMAVDAEFVYWIENGSEGGVLFRAPKAGGTRQQMASSEYPMRELKVDGGSAYFLSTFFALLCCVDIVHRVQAVGPLFITTHAPPLTQGTQAYAVVGSNVYAAVDSPGGGESVNIDRIPLSEFSDFGTFEEEHVIEGTANPRVTQILGDGANLFWQVIRHERGPIQRWPVAGGPVETLTDNLGEVRDMLVAGGESGPSLFFIESERILSLPVGSGALQFDLVANEVPLEVVQTIQGSAHDIPLIAERRTFVRAYARIGTSSEGITELRAYPGMALYGTRDGVRLEGSPLMPVNGPPPPYRDGAIDRTTMANTWLFELPRSWTEDGSITLRAVANPEHTLDEMDFGNNENSRTVNFNPVKGLCIDILPVLTHTGVSITSGLSAQFARARTLLPVADFGSVFRGGPIKSKPVTGDPYNMREEDDKNELMFHLTMEYLFSGDPPHCSGRKTIRAVAVADSDRLGLSNGSAPFIYWLASSGGVAENAPFGGTAGLAHEIGHQLGQAHINCPMAPPGNPANPDGSYPYNSCQLDTSNNHIGFDPMSRKVIAPFDAGGNPLYSDYMSYSPLSLWASDYVYKRQEERLALDPPLALALEQAGLDNVRSHIHDDHCGHKGHGGSHGHGHKGALLVSGYLGLGGRTSQLGYAYEIKDQKTLDFVQGKLAEWTQPSPDWEVRLRGAHGRVLERANLQVIADFASEEAGGSGKTLPFFALIEPASERSKIEIVDLKTQHAVLRRFAGKHDPRVRIHSPAAGATYADSIPIAWRGFDADGDRLEYRVELSNDGGSSWVDLVTTGGTSTSVDLSRMPGGKASFVKVLVSDGLRSDEAIVGPFSTPSHGPEVQVLLDEATPAPTVVHFAQSVAAILHAEGSDAEDGRLFDSAFSWRLSGPLFRERSGSEWREIGLTPGDYALELRAVDSSGASATSTVNVVIEPKQVAEGSAPVLDGRCGDEAYAGDADPVALRLDDGTLIQARLIRADGALHLCASGLPASEGDALELTIDPDRSGGSLSPTDRYVRIQRGSPIEIGMGDGSGGRIPLSLTPGVIAQTNDSTDGTFWSAELVLPESLVAGWDSLIDVRLSYQAVSAEASWPANSTASDLGSWGAVALEAPALPSLAPDASGPEEKAGGASKQDGCSVSRPGAPAGGGALLSWIALALTAARRSRRRS